eukprot:1161601-Pelagomonas_calceolata.AAC.2
MRVLLQNTAARPAVTLTRMIEHGCMRCNLRINGSVLPPRSPKFDNTSNNSSSGTSPCCVLPRFHQQGVGLHSVIPGSMQTGLICFS